MKMPEKHDLLAAILAAKEQGIGAILLRLVKWRTFPRWQMREAGHVGKENSMQRCAPLSPSSFVTFSTSPTK